MNADVDESPAGLQNPSDLTEDGRIVRHVGVREDAIDRWDRAVSDRQCGRVRSDHW
jgi:hypothetical protein